MDFPKKFGRLIKDQEETLPEGYSWEEMKEGVEEKMQHAVYDVTIQQNDNNGFKSSLTFKILLFAIIIFSLFTCHHLSQKKGELLVEYMGDEEESIEQVHQKITSSPVTQGKVKIEKDNLINSQDSNQELVAQITKANSKLSTLNSSRLATHNSPKVVDVLVALEPAEKKKGKEGSLNYNEGGTDKISSQEGGRYQSNAPEYATSQKIVESDPDQASSAKKQSVSLFAKIEPLLISKLRIAMSVMPLSNVPAIPKSRASHHPIYLSISGGSSFIIPHWQDISEGSSYNSHQRSLMGFNTDVRLDYMLNSRVSFATGVNYGDYISRLDYKGSEEIEVERENELVKVINNTTTGLVTEVRGIATVRIQQTRNVRSYNRFRLLSIPLTVRYTIERPKFSYGLGVGMAIQLDRSSSGKYVSTESILSLDNAVNEMSIGLLSELYLRYHINNRVSLQSSLWLNRQLSRWNLEGGVSLRPTLIQGQLGVGYRLN